MAKNNKIKDKVRELKRKVSALFLAYKHKDTPLAAKIVAAIAVGYALSPIDLIPDFIPVLGYLDDLIILPALIALTIHFIPKDTFERYRQEAQGMWQDGKPKKWFYAIPFIITWMLCAWLIARKFFPAG